MRDAHEWGIQDDFVGGPPAVMGPRMDGAPGSVWLSTTVAVASIRLHVSRKPLI
jgi:hypothetical protein